MTEIGNEKKSSYKNFALDNVLFKLINQKETRYWIKRNAASDWLIFFTDYKRTSLAKYVRHLDQFLDGMARSWKGELLKKSGMLHFSAFGGATLKRVCFV